MGPNIIYSDNIKSGSSESFEDNTVLIYAMLIAGICFIGYCIKKCIIGDIEIGKKAENDNNNNTNKSEDREMQQITMDDNDDDSDMDIMDDINKTTIGGDDEY